MSAAHLREAAKVLRERAEPATPPGHTHPWRYTEATYGNPADGPTHVAAVCCDANGVQPDHFIVAEEGATATADIVTYIATMHPGVGLALADWLDTAANNAERNGWMAGYTEAMRGTSAVRIADLILGEEGAR